MRFFLEITPETIRTKYLQGPEQYKMFQLFLEISFDNDKDNRAVSSVIMAQGPDVIGKIALCIQEIDAEEYVSEVFDEMPEKVRRAVAKLNLPKVAPMLEQNYGDNEETF